MSVLITIDGAKAEALPGETVAEAAARLGVRIPRLCNRESGSHRAGCMVCAVFDKTSGSFLPSCAARAAEGMDIEATGPRVEDFRKEALGLILAEHRGDCVAPCRKACPYGFDIPRFLERLTARDGAGIRRMLESAPDCQNCRRPCQTVCRRKFVDEAVRISDLIIANLPEGARLMEKAAKQKRYSHNFGKPSPEDLEKMAATSNDANRCLQCHCKKEDDCALRDLADEFGMSQPKQLKIKSFGRARANGVVFERAKCVLCAACTNIGGLSMRGRAHKASPDKPDGTEWADALMREHISACPTGAISKDETRTGRDE